jgi:peptidoglycan/LPS O-acetylase OafA/YrhL
MCDLLVFVDLTRRVPAGPPRPLAEPRAGRPAHIDALDVVRPVTNVGVVATHTTQAFAGVSVGSTLALAGLHATRHIFFVVSALALVYAHYGDREFSARRFWSRRLRLVVLPYVIWSAVYYLVSSSSLHGLDITVRPSPDSLTAQLRQFGTLLVTGTGHLYFIVVLIQFYVLFPAFLWVLRKTRRWHLPLLLASLGLQLWLDLAIHHGDLPAAFRGTSANRQILLYEFYLVAGGMLGAHAREVERLLWRFRWVLAPACVVVCGAVEYRVLHQLHGHVPVNVASDPFAPVFVFLNIAAFCLVYLCGLWWARSDVSWLKRLVRSASDNSFGVYLMHPLVLDTAAYLYIKPMIRAGGSRALAVALGVALVYACALAICSLMARTPLSLVLVGRAWRPLVGGPPPVGRGSWTGSWRVRRADAREEAPGSGSRGGVAEATSAAARAT